jgi:hypothetical protein
VLPPDVTFGISQIGLVCRDLTSAMAGYARLLGWGPWTVYRLEPPLLHDTIFPGRPAEFTMLAALTQVGDVQYELLQPLEGESAYTEHLTTCGEGLHHIAIDAPDSDDLRERLGRPDVLMSGRIGAATRFVYLDARPSLNVILETGAGDAAELLAAYVYP